VQSTIHLFLFSEGEMNMYNDKILSSQNLENFDFEATKKNVNDFFVTLELIEWEWAKLVAHTGLPENYEFSDEYTKEPYSPIGKDVFGISAKDCKEDQVKKFISNYYWAINCLSQLEQTYIVEYFVNRKYEGELMEQLGFYNTDSNEFRRLKKSAVFKFADFLNIVVEKA